jgi:hypothetical protein
MSHSNAAVPRPSLCGLQEAIDSADVVGTWQWDIPADRIVADILVALLFDIDPQCAEAGVPLSAFLQGVHPEDRARVTTLVAEHARAGRSYVAEYRVLSADGVTRWVLARGRFYIDGTGRPLRGHGIIVDITRSRLDEETAVPAESAPAPSPLDNAARAVLECHQLLKDIADRPILHTISSMLLLEIGRALAAQESWERRRAMN